MGMRVIMIAAIHFFVDMILKKLDQHQLLLKTTITEKYTLKKEGMNFANFVIRFERNGLDVKCFFQHGTFCAFYRRCNPEVVAVKGRNHLYTKLADR